QSYRTHRDLHSFPTRRSSDLREGADAQMSAGAPAKEAAKEVLTGEPGPSARIWLGPLTLAVWVVLATNTYLVATHPLLPFDVPVATFVQSVPWGPVAYLFELINATAGYLQVTVGLVAMVLLFIWERRAGYLMAIGELSSLLDNGIKLLMARERPGASLVHI